MPGNYQAGNIPTFVDDVTDARNRQILKCGKDAPDTQFARRIRAVVARKETAKQIGMPKAKPGHAR